MDNNYKKASILPLLLNQAMDSILKARYDKYRADGTFPPEAKELEQEGIKPFGDLKQLNDWRENIRSLEVVDEKGVITHDNRADHGNEGSQVMLLPNKNTSL